NYELNDCDYVNLCINQASNNIEINTKIKNNIIRNEFKFEEIKINTINDIGMYDESLASIKADAIVNVDSNEFHKICKSLLKISKCLKISYSNSQMILSTQSVISNNLEHKEIFSVDNKNDNENKNINRKITIIMDNNDEYKNKYNK